jgi:hypothetical protein
MERSVWFYILLGAGTVLVPSITDRLLKDRVSAWWRVTLDLVAAALTGAMLALIARPLGL